MPRSEFNLVTLMGKQTNTVLGKNPRISSAASKLLLVTFSLARTKTALRQRNHPGRQNPPALFFLDENDCAQVLHVPFRIQFHGWLRRKSLLAVLPHNSYHLQLPQHRRMLQFFADVFSAFHGSVQPALRNGENHLAVSL